MEEQVEPHGHNKRTTCKATRGTHGLKGARLERESSFRHGRRRGEERPKHM